MTIISNPIPYIFVLDGTETVTPIIKNFKIGLAREDKNVFYQEKITDLFKFKGADYVYLEAKNSVECPALTTIAIKQYCNTTKTYVTIWNGTFSTRAGEWNFNECAFDIKLTLNGDYSSLVKKGNVSYNILAIKELFFFSATGGGETYNRVVLLDDVISYIVDDIAGLTYVSDFFKTSPNPLTGSNPNALRNTGIIQKSDVITPSATNPATQGEITFNELMTIIAEWVNAFWYIDGNGDFRIEHFHYFENNVSYSVAKTVGTDLTTLDGGKHLTNNKLRYDKENTPSREKWNFAEANGVAFVGFEIIYPDACNANEKDIVAPHDLSSVTTDVKYIQDKPDQISSSGWVLLNLNRSFVPAQIFEEVLSFDIDVFKKMTGTVQVGTLTITDNNFDISMNPFFAPPDVYLGSHVQTWLNPEGEYIDFEVGDVFHIEFDFAQTAGSWPNPNFASIFCGDPFDNLNPILVSNEVFVVPGGHISLDLTVTTAATQRIVFLFYQWIGNVGTISLEITNYTINRTSVTALNGHFSLFSLHTSYWRYGRFYSTGLMNQLATNFLSVLRQRIQDKLEFPICCLEDFDPNELIRTQNGDAELLEGTYDAFKKRIKTTLLL